MSEEIVEFFEIFPWDRNFETGIEEVDEQHKRLVDILNHLAAHLANRSHPATLNHYFDQLAEYADYHFKSEEKVWHAYLEGVWLPASDVAAEASDHHTSDLWTIPQASLLSELARLLAEEPQPSAPGGEEVTSISVSKVEKTPRILIAEDNEINQDVITRQLSLLGYEAEMADNPKILS